MAERGASEGDAAARFLVAEDGQRHALPSHGSVTLGCAPAAKDQLHFDAPGLDERHCVIGRTKSGGWALKDLGSHAGSRINGERVTSARLKPGDELDLAGVLLRFAAEGHDAPPKSRTPKALGRLGGFRLERRLGRGGMGDVLLAVQESLDRRVALKLLKQRLADDADFVQRFQTEAKSAAALNHPNVVHVYDVGIIDGRHYLAMEYMEGGTLEQRLAANGPLGADEVHRVLVETAQGLAFAEERGILHLDIKPDNLMLDGTGRVKIADLGLATSIEAEGDGKTKVLGTPHFMAPEQARGGKLDGRTDLYALGATAYRLLTAKTPFDGATTRDILRAHFTQEPPHPSAVVPEVPAELDALVVKLMAKQPEQRYASARDLLAALATIQPRTTSPAAGSSRPRALGLAAVGIALLAAGAAWLFWPSAPAPEPPPEDQPVVGGLPDPGPLPEIDSLPTIPEVAPDVPEDNEQQLQNLEKLARGAYKALEPITEPSARAAALEELIAGYPGTTTATEAAAERETLLALVAAADQAAATRAAELARLESILSGVSSKAARLDDGAPEEPGALLAELMALEAPGDADLAAFFEDAREEALAATLDQIAGHVRSGLERAESLAAVGDFDRYQAELEALASYLALAEPSQDALVELAAQLEARLAERPQREAAYLAALERGDRATLAANLYAPASGQGGLRDELEALELEAAAQRLEELLPKLQTDQARQALTTLAAELRSAAGAFELLITSFQGAEWRRDSVPLPFGGYGTATKVDPTGMTIVKDDSPRTYTWADYKGQPELIDGLFKKRLRREYTAVETEGIASLARISGVLGALDIADKLLINSPKPRFDQGNAEDMLAAFEVAEQWAAEAPIEREACAREEAAAALLGSALVARAEGQDALSAARLEALLRDHSTSLCVLLLSDGGGPMAAQPGPDQPEDPRPEPTDPLR